MPIQGSGGETAIQYGGNTYINDNPTRTAYNNYNKPVVAPTKNVPRPAPKPPAPKYVAPKPKPVYKPYSPPPAPMGKLNNLYNPVPTSWANAPAPVAMKPYSPPAAPLGKLTSVYSPNDTSQTIGKPQAPTAFDQKWNPAYTGSVPLGKLYNLYNPTPDPSIGAKTAWDQKYLSGQYNQQNNAINYMNNPTGLADSIDHNNGWGGVLNDLKNFFTPQFVDSKPADVQNPILTAQKAINQNNSDPWTTIENLGKGAIAPLVGLASLFNNNDKKNAPQDANARDITDTTPTPASQLSPYPRYGNGIDLSSLFSGQAPSASNPYGLPTGSNSSSSSNSKSSGVNPNSIDPNITVMTTDKDGNPVKATPFDIAYNPDLYKQYLAQKNGGATGSPTVYDTTDATMAANQGVGQERDIIPHGDGATALLTVPPASSGDTGASGGTGTADLNNVGLGSGGLGGLGGLGGGSGLLDSMLGGGGNMAGLAGGSGIPTDGSGQPSFLDYGLNQDEQNALMQYAKGQALLQNNVQRDSLDLQSNQQNDAYNSQVGQLNNDLQNAEQQLENQSFQDYLKSRQDIADRGLGSSGLANDADTRLMLDRDQQLGTLQRQNDTSLSSALATKNTNLSNIAAQRSQINDDVTANNLFQQLYSQRLQSKQQANQLAEDWAKWNQTSGNYAYRYGVSAQNAQLSAATKLQVAQMANSMKLQTTDMNNSAKMNIAAGNLQAKLQQINNQAWNWGQQQNISLANQLGQGAMNLLKQIPNATSPQEAQGLLNQYNSMMDEFATQLGQAQDGTSAPSGFNYSSGGGGGYTGSVPSSYNQQLQQVVGAGYLPQDQVAAFNKIIQMESSFNPNAKNSHSTAYGYGQFLDSTRAEYEKKMGMSYNNPVNQLAMTAQYIKDRYGTAQNALAFHLQHGWY